MHSNLRRLALTALLLAAVAPSAHAAAAAAATVTDPIAALLAGNARFVKGTLAHPHQDAKRRAEVATGQHPYAVIVSCSDSRVGPEVVFDQGLGDLFVVRTAGHVVDPVALGSIEFAVAKLGARAIYVLGHERCGAVQAALEHAEVPGSIGKVLETIEPVVGGPEKATPEALASAVTKQVRAVATSLRTVSPVLTPMVNDGSLRIAGGVYDLDSGKVEPVAMEGTK